MHLSSLCLRLSKFSSFSQDARLSCRFGKRLWQNSHDVRLLHVQDFGGSSTGHQDIRHFEALNGQRKTFKEKKAEDNEDIFIDSLSATLEAHRATNRIRLSKGIRNRALVRRLIPGTKKLIRKVQSHHRPGPSSFDTGVNLDQTQTASVGIKTTISETRTTSQSDEAPNQATLKKQLMGNKQKRSTHLASRLPTNSDYTGVAMEPIEQWQLLSSKGGEQSPWLPLVTGTEGDGLARLQNEIKAYENYMSLKPCEIVVASSVFREIKSIVKESDPSVSVHILGSYSSGLAIPTSNLNLQLSLRSFHKDPLSRGPSPGRKVSRTAGHRFLQKLQPALLDSKSFQSVILEAPIFVLKALHLKTGLEVRIECCPALPASTSYIATYLSQFPTLRPLFILLRLALTMRGLETIRTGGLSSYAIFMMIVYALNQNAADSPRHDIASQLLYILKLYSEADLYKYGLSPDPPRMFDKSIVGKKGSSKARLYGIDVLRKHNERPSDLCLQDPADPTNDLGFGSYAMKHVQEVFRSARERIEQAMSEWEAMAEIERQNVDKGCLDPLVGACYAQFERRRSRVERNVGPAEEFIQDLKEECFFENQTFRKVPSDR